MGLVGCGHEPAGSKPGRGTDAKPAKHAVLRIAAAADLKFALEDVVAAFQRTRPDATVTVTHGSSGNLFAQLSSEAPFDLFLSADIEYPRRLIEQGHATQGSEFSYAAGHIVIWAPNDSPLDVEHGGIEILREEGIRKIAVANPRTAPYGRAAVAALKNLKVYDAVESRLVYGENVAQAAQMIESGGADVGIIALSLAVSPALRDKGKYWQIPGDAHPPIVQGGVILRWAEDARLAEEFRDFLLSADGTAILRQFGFVPPGD
jgi:molybdate transport system substrate-binding protein